MTSNELNKVQFVTQKLTILIAEDDEVALDIYKRTMEPFFKEVRTATNGAEAFEIYEDPKNKIDIIVTDINMPHVSGLELIKKIRSINQLIPIIVVSAYTETDNFVEFISAGVSSFLPKPLNAKALFHCAYSAAIKVDDMRMALEYQQKLEEQIYAYMSQIEALKKENMALKYELNFDLCTLEDTTGLKCDINPSKEGYFASISAHDRKEFADALEHMLNHHLLISNSNVLANRARLDHIVSEIYELLIILQQYPIFAKLTHSIDDLCMYLITHKNEMVAQHALLGELLAGLKNFHRDVIATESTDPNTHDEKILDIIKKIIALE
jgi:CheY-like chemotaxis protein